ncbi:MAG: hypothetical protein AAFQ82_25995, partial [Myxococcota bacterium]
MASINPIFVTRPQIDQLKETAAKTDDAGAVVRAANRLLPSGGNDLLLKAASEAHECTHGALLRAAFLVMGWNEKQLGTIRAGARAASKNTLVISAEAGANGALAPTQLPHVLSKILMAQATLAPMVKAWCARAERRELPKDHYENAKSALRQQTDVLCAMVAGPKHIAQPIVDSLVDGLPGYPRPAPWAASALMSYCVGLDVAERMEYLNHALFALGGGPYATRSANDELEMVGSDRNASFAVWCNRIFELADPAPGNGDALWASINRHLKSHLESETLRPGDRASWNSVAEARYNRIGILKKLCTLYPGDREIRSCLGQEVDRVLGEIESLRGRRHA